MRTTVLSLLAALVFSPSIASALTVDDAIKQALGDHGNIRERGAREQAKGAGDTALSVGARMLFSLHVSDEFQYYNCPFAVSFSPSQAGCLSSIGATPAGGQPPLVVRNQTTNSFVVSGNQPLLGLLRLSHDYLAQKRSAKSAAEGVNANDAKLVENIRNGFLRYFESVASEDVAKASETELTEQVRVATSREKVGVITIADRLRVQVALANARQQRVKAHAQAEVARATLLDAIGYDPNDETVTLEEPSQLLVEATQPMPERAAAAQDAINRRPEVKQAKLTYESAVAARRSRVFAMLPDADLEAAYVRVDGQIFAPKNSYYVGIKAQWAFWEWGSGFFAQRASHHQANAAAFSLEDQKRQVVLEVKNAFSNLEAASAAVVASKEAIDSANEAFRVTARSVEAGTATTTDLLSSQSELTTARLNLTRSSYEQAMARVTLRRLTGD
ncbi:MAG: TolC family protein [Polyangia bacterium]